MCVSPPLDKFTACLLTQGGPRADLRHEVVFPTREAHMQRKLIIVVSVILTLFVGIASAKDVVIVTSFPKELFETYKKTFEAKNPGITVVINSKQTNAGVTYLRETKARPDADIFWVSAPDAFQTLDTDGLLEKYAPPKEIMAKIPAKIGNFPIHDPDGKYCCFAISR